MASQPTTRETHHRRRVRCRFRTLNRSRKQQARVNRRRYNYRCKMQNLQPRALARCITAELSMIMTVRASLARVNVRPRARYLVYSDKLKSFVITNVIHRHGGRGREIKTDKKSKTYARKMQTRFDSRLVSSRPHPHEDEKKEKNGYQIRICCVLSLSLYASLNFSAFRAARR